MYSAATRIFGGVTVDEEYAMAVKCGDPNHLIGECLKPPKNNDQRAFIGRAWSDNGEDKVEKTKDETCLVAQAPDEICLGINLEPDEWIKDSVCSKHMIGNRKLFSSYKAYNGGNVVFGSHLRGKIIGKGFPAQSVGSFNMDVLDSPCLLVLITGMSQSRQHVITSSIHIESCKSPTKSLFEVGSSRISIFTVNT
nr:retrovirus-related Pol polyprotein from transposon TNT 1-94 [Tanacetum cinerariifolium]